MATRSEINFNYRQAIRQANRLDRIAQNIERLSKNRIENTKGSLKSSWKSDSSSAYYAKVSKVQDDIVSNAKKVRKVADAIRAIATEIRRAELEALEIAQQRSYSR